MDTSPRTSLRALFARVLGRLVALQVDRPWAVLLVAVVLTIPSILLARRLELHTGFESLLPENKASVQELKKVAERTAGVSTFVIVAEAQPRPDGGQEQALQRFGDALLPRLRALGPEWVGTAENGVQAEQAFLKQRRALFLPLDKLRALQEHVEDRFAYEVNGSLMDDVPPPISRASVEKDLGIDPGKAQAGPPYPGGYYMNAARTRLVTLIRTPVVVGDLKRTQALIERVRGAIEATGPARFDPTITTGFTGDVVVGAEQYGTVKNDLASVGAAGILMILFVDWLFFLRLRAVVAMGLAIGVGVLWCFALTEIVIGHLNTASGFLVSIVFGNGINFGILLRARYNEARRAGLPLREAVTRAYRDTWRPTLTVAAAAGVGFVSLATTSFRGFRDFGVIGGYGMLLCWASNYLFMVPLLVVFERLSPTFQARSAGSLRARVERWIDHGVPFGAPFAALARWAPALLIAVVGLGAGAYATVSTVRWLRADPLEYQLWKLENDPGAPSAASKLGEKVDEATGHAGPRGMAIMVERVDQVKPLLAELDARLRAAPPARKPFQKVVSIFDLVPDQQDEKLAILTALRARFSRIHALGKLSDDDYRELEGWLPPVDLRPFGIDDLPERVARPFTERDGTRGRIVFIAPTEGQSVRDVRYLRRWADAYREVRLPNGETIVGSGRAVIFADLLEAVIAESPKAIALSLLGTALVVVIAFSRGRGGVRAALLVLLALGLGVAWMGGALAALGVKINFLNFIAAPITFGIGVDYAINVVHRWRVDGPGSVVHTVRETGGAVVLCSLTTSLGYLALLRSMNAAVRSFGLAAVIGELACLSAALIVLPAILLLIDRWRARSGRRTALRMLGATAMEP
jgi:hypothetical protein